MIAVLAAGIGGCSSDVGRFGSDPVYTGSTPNQRQILGSTGDTYGGHAYAAPSAARRSADRSWQNVDTTGSIGPGEASVYRRDLSPPPAVVDRPYAETVAQPLSAAVRPETPVDTGETRVAGVGGWTGTGGSYVTLQQGETIDGLSRRYGVPVTAIQQANGYTPTRSPMPGERVLIPVYNAAVSTPAAPAAPAMPPRQISLAKPAPAAAAPMPQQRLTPPPAPPAPVARAPQPAPLPVAARQPQAPVPPAAQPPAPRVATVAPPPQPQPPQSGVKLVGAYTVRQGDTLASIARTYGVSEQALRERNQMKSSAVAPGQQILLPAGTKLMLKTSQAQTPAPTTTASTPAKAPTQVAEKPADKPAAKTQVASTAKIDQKAAETIAVAREPSPSAEDDKASATPGSFRWPARGRVISEFGAKPNGERNEGINLAVPEGTSIKAADDGEVIYSGNELKGYGNLVLVRHQNGFVTAYAHASELLVNRGEKVGRGQIIARAGATGSVTQPQLHFELRKGQKAIDPKPYLASN